MTVLAVVGLQGSAAVGTPDPAAVMRPMNTVAPGQFTFSAATYSVSENAGNATITVNRIDGSEGAISVQYETSGGTATVDVDYTPSSGLLYFMDGITSQTFTIPILDDSVAETDETVGLSLFNPIGGTIAGGSSTLTITNVPKPGGLQFSAATYSVSENSGTATITVTRTNGWEGSVSVNYATSDGTGAAGTDYTASSGTVTFADGESSQTFVVPVFDDLADEADETVNLTLSGPSGGATLGGQATAVLTITNALHAEFWERQEPQPTGRALRAIAAVSPTGVFAVGEQGAVVRYDGTTWTSMPSGSTSQLNDIWGEWGYNNLIAVGSAGTILRYQGSWLRMESGIQSSLRGVWGIVEEVEQPPDPENPEPLPPIIVTSIMAVGDNGVILQYNGTSWSPMTSGISSHLSDVWGSSSTNVYTVGFGGLILHYNGSTWTPMTSGITVDLTDVWGSSPNDVFAVGESGVILHYNGSAWTPMTSGTDEYLCGVSGTSGNDVFAVGYNGVVLHYNGTTWNSMDSGSGIFLESVWTSPQGAVYSVGDSGTILQYNGQKWLHKCGGFYPTAIWGTADDNLYAAGHAGPLLRYNGTLWSRVPGLDGWYQDVWGTSATSVYAVGSGGRIARFDGTQWTPMASGTTEYLEAVWGSSDSDIFAVGGAIILHYNGTSWSPMTSGTTQLLQDVWGTSPTNVFVVGTGGTVLHYNGTGWAPMTSGTTRWLTTIWATSENDIYAVGSRGTIIRYNGTAWTPMAAGTQAELRGIWGNSTNLFVGAGTTILRYNGSSWLPWSSPLPDTVNAGLLTPGGHTFVAGNQSILHLTTPPWRARVEPDSAVIDPVGGWEFFFQLTVPDDCDWTADPAAEHSSDNWIGMGYRDTGLGSNGLVYRVEPNTGVERKAVINVADVRFTVRQLSPGCSYALGLSSIDLPNNPVSHSVSVTSGTGCEWTATKNQDWITITSGTGTANGWVDFSLTANTGDPRTGTITVAGQVLTINQAGGYFPPNPTNLTLSKTHSGNAWLGQTTIYTLTVSNPGAQATNKEITVTDDLPTGLTYVSGTGTGWTCGCVQQTVTCTRTTPIQPGASGTISIATRASAAAVPSVINTASLSYEGDTTTADNSSSDSVQVFGLSRAFVSTTGSDSNSCNASAPCRTLAKALAVVLPGAEVVALDSGGYGPATIENSVSIYAPMGIHAGVTVNSGDGLTINAPGGLVILRGLFFNSGGGLNAISVIFVDTLYVENCQIMGFPGNGVNFSAPYGRLILKSTDIRGCGGTGLVVSPPPGSSGRLFVEGSSFAGNGAGVNTQKTIGCMVQSWATGNETFGIQVATDGGFPAKLALSGVVALYNGTGIQVMGAQDRANLLLTGCLVSGNGTGILKGSGESFIVSSGRTNLITGNAVDVDGEIVTLVPPR